jgi:uncharacterized membrane protein
LDQQLMARRSRTTILAWHRPLIVVASIVVLALVGWAAYFVLFTGFGASAEARLLSGSPISAVGVSGQATPEGASGFRLCNKTASRVGVAIGYKEGTIWTTEGWWNVNGGACETLMPGPLVSRFYYVYAIDYDRGGVWGGKANMCTRDKMFTIKGIEDCLARGYERSGFFEVDTGEQKSWTVQLTAPGAAG